VELSKNRRILNSNLKKCSRCGLPETYETIEFDDFGVCNICSNTDYKVESIDWSLRSKQLEELVSEFSGKNDYDCIVPFSGGKDSTFTLWYIVKKLKLKPLVVQFNHGFMRPTLIRNNERTFKQLGVDVISFTPKWSVVKLLMRESFIRKGDFCWHCHTGIFSYPMHVAINYNVPLVFWGEPSAEYTAYYDYKSNEIEMVDEVRFNRITNLGLTGEDMLEILSGNPELDPRDMKPYTYPKLESLVKLDYKSVALGSYIPWDVKKNYEIIKDELGWEGDEVEGMPPGLYPYEKIECYMQGSRDYIKFLKRGYGRVTQMTALDIRNGRMAKQEAEELIEKFEGKRPASLDLLLEYLEMSEGEFEELVQEMAVPPNKPFFETIPIGRKTHDFDSWYRESK
jgi:N-acetyl sugar amidotransferase